MQTLDLLEETATRLGKTEWELFQEICDCSQVKTQRMDALWDGYVTEDFIPDFIEACCLKILMGTTGFKEES